MDHRGNNLFTSTLDESYTSDTKILTFHQGYYQAESTLQRYNVPTKPIQMYIPVVIIMHQTTKVYHPFDVEENHLSKYPVNFRGRYCCRSTYHYINKDWYIIKSSDFDSEVIIQRTMVS